MGALTRFRLSDEFVERFPMFIETGTGKGVSLSYAADHGFAELVSVEIDERLVTAARQRFADDDRVEIVQGRSDLELADLLGQIPSEIGILFWLDAHSPGGDYFGVSYDAEPDRRVRLPLEEEFSAIRRARTINNYTIIVDDLRIYEDGDYEHGNIPPGIHNLKGADRHLRFVDGFAATHDIIRDGHDAGYLILSPKGAPRPEIIEHGVRELVEIARRNVEAGDMISARVSYQAVLNATQNMLPPDVGLKKVARGEACRYMAAVAMAERRDGTACDWFLEAAACDPLAVEYRMDLIFKLLIPMRSLEIAQQQAQIITRIAPDNPRGWHAVAAVEREFGDAVKMRRAVDHAIALAPADADTLRVRAMLSGDTGDLDEAARCYRILGERPAHRAKALMGYAIIQGRAGDHEGALASLDEAIATPGLAGEEPMAIWHRAEVLLTLGRYAEGWKDQEKRFDLERRMPGVGPAGSRFLRPLFKIDDPPSRVHVHAEQGFGDTICMARYVMLLRDMGHDVRFEVQEEMVGLFRDSFDGVKVVPRALDYPGSLGLEDFDSHVPAMCFPAIFGTTINTVPWSGPYLHLRDDEFRPCVIRRVGLCWSAGARPGLWHAEYAKRKSVPQEAFLPLFCHPMVDERSSKSWGSKTFVSLQLGGAACDNKIPVARMLDEASTWADTAAVIAGLDLVITVDTSVAHLAGAMGKLTWLMLHTGGSWHWMLNREDSPWYPSVRIFRQERPHEWSPVISRIAAELAAL